MLFRWSSRATRRSSGHGRSPRGCEAFRTGRRPIPGSRLVLRSPSPLVPLAVAFTLAAVPFLGNRLYSSRGRAATPLRREKHAFDPGLSWQYYL